MSAPHLPYRESPPPGYRAGYAPAPLHDNAGLVWPWVFLGAVLTPVLLFMACTAVLGSASTTPGAAPDKGGEALFGETFHYSNGLAVVASVPRPYQPRNEFELGRDQAAVAVTFTVTNATEESVNMGLFRANATFAGSPAPQAAAADLFPTQDVPSGRSLTVTQAFVVPPSAKGPFQVAVRHGFKEPIYFNGQL